MLWTAPSTLRALAPLVVLLAVCASLLAAPLVLGSLVVLQGESRRVVRLWVAGLAGLLAAAVGLGVVALVLLLLA